jgi:ion channel
MVLFYSSMTLPLLFGFGTFVCTIFILALVFSVIMRLIEWYIQKGHVSSISHNILAISVTVILILISHICSIVLWAWVFILLGEFGSFETAFYFSGVSYTTLGYGDIILSKAWRLLGPLEAVNGVIMFGWTTAMIFAVQISLIRQRLKTKSPL